MNGIRPINRRFIDNTPTAPHKSPTGWIVNLGPHAENPDRLDETTSDAHHSARLNQSSHWKNAPRLKPRTQPAPRTRHGLYPTAQDRTNSAQMAAGGL